MGLTRDILIEQEDHEREIMAEVEWLEECEKNREQDIMAGEVRQFLKFQKTAKEYAV